MPQVAPPTLPHSCRELPLDPIGQAFPPTEWSVISWARGDGETLIGEGRGRLCARYWKPLYLYLRRNGESHEDASDSVQGFFQFVLSSDFLSYVNREGGRFRSYLVKSLERWRTGQRRHHGAQKRGGHWQRVPLDGLDAFGETADFATDVSPELAFDRQWATDMVGSAFLALQDSYAKRGRDTWFQTLKAALPGGGSLPPYEDLAKTLGVTEGAVRKAVHDLRSAFATEMRREIRATVRHPEDADDELRHLISVMARR